MLHRLKNLRSNDLRAVGGWDHDAVWYRAIGIGCPLFRKTQESFADDVMEFIRHAIETIEAIEKIAARFLAILLLASKIRSMSQGGAGL